MKNITGKPGCAIWEEHMYIFYNYICIPIFRSAILKYSMSNFSFKCLAFFFLMPEQKNGTERT